MTAEEKKALNKARAEAVRKAWENEKKLVAEGKCTRQWTRKEIAELNRKGHISGYVGHHMKSVNAYPKYAGDPNNIQFLTAKEHIAQAHNNNTKAATNGYYNPHTKTTEQFRGAPQKPVYSMNVFSGTNQSASRMQSGAASQNSAGSTASTRRYSSDKGRGASHTAGTSTAGASPPGRTGSYTAKRSAGTANGHSE